MPEGNEKLADELEALEVFKLRKVAGELNRFSAKSAGSLREQPKSQKEKLH
jgi:hypothetical protein